MTRQEINDRLAAIRERLDALTPEVDALSNGAPYKLGSRVSFVGDRIRQAVEEINDVLAFPDEPQDNGTFGQ